MSKIQFTKEELIDKLHQQIKCIDKSLKIFSVQDMEEALRIATSLRVLLHNTQNSTFLFH